MWIALLFVASFQVLAAITPISVPLCQEGKEFDCGSGVLRCIPNEWKCDNVRDCDDGSDEAMCNYNHNCSKEFMLCGNGVCASKEFKCDGEKDCSDGSDELHCGYYANLTVSNTNSTCHSVKQFSCGSDSPLCIPAQWQCDNIPDCQNGTDEIGCTYKATCTENYMICKSGECVHKIYKCDGDKDCADGSDENNCVTEKDKPAIVDDVPECKTPRMRCSSGHCLRAELVCDGQFDCSDGEDEENCTRSDGDQSRKFECHPDQSLCFNGNVCIPHSFFCDGVPDCEDGSDELNCGERAPSKEDIFSGLSHHLRSCRVSGKFICKPKNGKAGVCIPMDATCNGVKECPLGDDEPEKCLECDTKGCDHDCENSFYGATCTCRDKYWLAEDGKTCNRDDPCLTEGRVCQQFCESRNTSFVCSCSTNYTLDSDGHSCRLAKNISREGYLFVSLKEEVLKMPLPDYRNVSIRSIFTKYRGKETIRSIDFMHRTNKMFMIISEEDAYEERTGRLAVSENAKVTVLREDFAGIKDIAVDWVGGNLFFTRENFAPVVGLSVCTMDGRFCRQLLQTRPFAETRRSRYDRRPDEYRSLVVHPLRGLIIWIDHTLDHHRIMTASMDGTNIQVLLDAKLADPTALAVDYIRNDVYFGKNSEIERVNIDTRHRTTLVSSGVKHIHDMAYFNGVLYWTEWESKTLRKLFVAQNDSTPITIETYHTATHGLAINHSLYQPEPAFNPCSKLDCPWICVVVPDATKTLTAKCLCPNGYKSAIIGRTETCIPPALNETASLRKFSSFGSALMADLCKSGTACKNEGKCRVETNELTEKISTCECRGPYDGLFCERRIRGKCPVLVILFLSLLLLLAVVTALIYFCIVKRKFSTDMLARAHLQVAGFFKRNGEESQEPYVVFGNSNDRKDTEMR